MAWTQPQGVAHKGQAEVPPLSWISAFNSSANSFQGVVLCDTGSHCVAQADLKFTILLSWLPKH